MSLSVLASLCSLSPSLPSLGILSLRLAAGAGCNFSRLQQRISDDLLCRVRYSMLCMESHCREVHLSDGGPHLPSCGSTRCGETLVLLLFYYLIYHCLSPFSSLFPPPVIDQSDQSEPTHPIRDQSDAVVSSRMGRSDRCGWL